MRAQPNRAGRKRGFTLLEVTFAMGILGFGLLGLFALHNVAIGANRHAARLTACRMLAQQQMEYLLALPYPYNGAVPADLAITNSDSSTTADPYAFFAHPTGTTGTKPSPVSLMGTTSSSDGALSYYRTWDVSYPMTGETNVIQIKVRVVFYDKGAGKPHGVTVSSFRYKDPA